MTMIGLGTVGAGTVAGVGVDGRTTGVAGTTRYGRIVGRTTGGQGGGQYPDCCLSSPVVEVHLCRLGQLFNLPTNRSSRPRRREVANHHWFAVEVFGAML